MKFDRLQAAIANRADQDPSIYMALCMIEALFLDVEKAAGRDLCQCPVGDEKLPTKLVWLCKAIREIYEENTDQLQANRARLDSLVHKTDVLRQELETTEDASVRLEQLQQEYALLAKRLASRQQAQEEYDRLQSLYDRDKARLEALRVLDTPALETGLGELQASILQLEQQHGQAVTRNQAAQARKDSLTQAVEAMVSQNEALSQAVTVLEQKLTDQDRQLHHNTGLRDGLLDKIQASESQLRQLEEEQQQLGLRLQAGQQSLAGLQEQGEQTRQQLQDLQAQEAAVSAQLRELTAQHRDEAQAAQQLRQQLSEAQDACTRQNQLRDTLLTDIRTQEAACQQLTEDNQQLEQSLAAITEQVRTYQTDRLEPLRAALVQTQQELLALEQTRQALEQEHRQLQDSRSALTVDIARKKDDTDTLRDKLTAARKNMEDLQHEQAGLQAQLDSQTDGLARLQELVTELKNVRLPEVFQLIEQETVRRDQLVAAMEKAAAEQTELAGQIACLEAEAPGLQEQLGQVRARYDVLSASSIANNNELQSLQQQVTALSAQHSDSQQELLRSQLREKIRKLEELGEDCDRLARENDARQAELDRGNEKLNELRSTKLQLESGRENLQKQQRELNFSGFETYRRDLSALEKQLRALTALRERMGATLATIQKAIALPPLTHQELMEEQFLLTLRQLQQHVNSLRQQLIDCAQSVRLEETK